MTVEEIAILWDLREDSPRLPLCEWAGCPRLAVTREDGYAHCALHLAEHRVEKREQEGTKTEKPRPDIRQRVATLHAGGLSDRAIAARIPCDRATVRHHRTALGLACNTDPVPLQPCGTHAAFERHKTYGEPIDDVCREGERAYHRDRYQRERARRRGRAS
jgi:hypothetical protein